MIVIEGEKDIIVIHLTSFGYIGVEGEIIETPFQYLEVVNVLTVQQELEPPKLEILMAFWQGDKAIIEVRNAQGWGKLVEVHEKNDKFELVYQSSSN